MNPVRSSLQHVSVTLAIAMALCATGIYSLLKMPRREDPKITIRTGLISAKYPGATAEQVEKQVTIKIEERLFRYAEVRKERTFSTSRPNAAIINVELEDWVSNPDTFWSKLRHDMNQLKATDLPQTVRGPVVDSDFGDTIAVLIAVRGSRYGYRELKNYSQKIEESIRTLRPVAKIKRVGEQPEEIQITSSLERLSQYSLNPTKVIGALQGRNTIEFAGSVHSDKGSVQLNPNGPFQSEEQIRRVIVDVSPLSGQPVHIGDLADVHRGYKDLEFATRFNGEPALMLSVEMQEGNNIVEFGEALRRKLDEVTRILPPDLRIDLVADQPEMVRERISHFIKEFGIAIAAVILVTVLLLPFRVALIAALAIPSTVAITFSAINLLGIQLHQVSIAALIVVLGMVVDDAIVIADNYVELLDRKVPIAEAAWRCATEMAVPVLTATLTIVASFLPLLMLSGAVGEFIHALPITVASALLVSYAVAMLLTPLLARFFIKKGLRHENGESAQRMRAQWSPLAIMQRLYIHGIRFSMQHKAGILLGTVLMLGAGGLMLHFTHRQFFPSAERNQFIIDVFSPEGTRIEATDALSRRIENHLSSKTQIRDYSTFLGGSAPRFYYNVNPQQPASNYVQFLINTRSMDATPPLAHRLRGELSRLAPEALVIVRELQQGHVMEAPVEIRVSGEDIARLKTIGEQVKDIVQSTSGALYTNTDYREDLWQMRIDVKDEIANRLGISNSSIARQLAGSFHGLPVTTFWEGDRAVDVTLRVEEDRRNSFDHVENAYVTSLITGARFPLRAVASFRPEWESGRIVRRNGVRTLTVRTYPDEHHFASELLASAKPKIERLDLPDGYRLEYGGEAEKQKETFSELLGALAVSIVCIFLILLFQFRSISTPLVVMASIPMAFPGAAAGLLMFGNPFGFTAFMGIVSLGGIVVRNAIILVDYIAERVHEGEMLEHAALEAGQRRLRPIFLTTMAAAVGVAPMILSGSSLWSPLASTIAIGLIVSMFFTLLVVPVLYVLVKKRSVRRASGASVAAGALALMLLFTPPAKAEERPITIDEAVHLALKNNSLIKLSTLKIQEAEAKRIQAHANYFPQLSNESTLYNIIEKQRLTLPAGSLGTVPPLGSIPQSPTTIYQGGRSLLLAQTTAAQPLTQLLKIREGNAVAQSDVAIAKTQSGRARVEIAAKTRELYYAVLGLEARKRASQAAIVAAEERLKERKDEAESGTALEVRAMQAQAALIESRQAALTIDIQIEDIRAELNDLLGLPLNTHLILAPAAIIDNVPPLEEFVQKAVEQNLELQSARQTIAKAEHGVTAAKLDLIPDVGFFTQYIYQAGVPFLASHNGVFGLKMNLTLFDWGKKSGAIKERQAQLAQAEEESSRMERRIKIDVEKAYRRRQRVAGIAIMAREAVRARKEAQRIVQDQYELGLCRKAEYEEAKAASLAMEADFAAAEYQIMAAAADIDRLAGIE
jgi:multidrug efflux pump subunit AcrB/outer membrane protein TolC